MESLKKQNNSLMESLCLPKELYWNGKMEPISPPTGELFSVSDSIEHWLIEDNFATDISQTTDGRISEPKKCTDLITLLNNEENIVLEFYDMKEEQWADTKPHSPQFLGYNSLGIVIEQPSLITKVQNPFDLKDVISEYDTSILSQLTPPQSPPRIVSSYTQNDVTPENQNSSNVEEIIDLIVQQHQLPTLPQLSPTTSNSSTAETACQSMLEYNWNNSGDVTETVSNFIPFQSEIDRETQIVDEIVKTRAKELLDWNEDSESSSSLSPSSNLSSADEDWLQRSSSAASYSTDSFECGGGKILDKNLNRKRPRPYGRCPEDRKSRKKEQNKNAATRYRQKKKQEMETVLSEEQALTQKNEELKKTLADRKREAKYLKTLIKEFYQKNRNK